MDAKFDTQMRNSEETTSSRPCKYKAFISYSHNPVDSAVGKDLLESIESYVIPKTLRKGQDRHLGKVFRDEDELAASYSLNDELKSALRDSEYLIVLCSPKAASSHWVSTEIEEFKSTHDQQHVLAVMVSGEPEESFPAPLFEGDIEPLAVDMRDRGDKKKMQQERLRLFAALLGCSYDELLRRNAARKKRRVLMSLAIAAVSIAILGFLLGALASVSEEGALSESRQLASESTSLASNGQRRQAIQTALEALPSGSLLFDKPVSSEALQALDYALAPYMEYNLCWKDDYVLEGQEQTNMIAASGDGWFATADTVHSVTVYDVKTGSKIAHMDMLQHSRGEIYGLTCVGDCIAVSMAGTGLFCFDAFSGEKLWGIEELVVLDSCSVGNGEALCVFGGPSSSGAETLGFAGRGAHLALVNARTGEIAASKPVAQTIETGWYLEASDASGKIALAVNGSIRVFTAESLAQEHAVKIGDAEVVSLRIFPSGLVYAKELGTNKKQDATKRKTYTVDVCAFDFAKGATAWKYRIDYLDYKDSSGLFFNGQPVIVDSEAFANGAGSAAGQEGPIVVTADDSVYLFDIEKGLQASFHKADSPIVGSCIMQDGDAVMALFTTFEGSHYSLDLTANKPSIQQILAEKAPVSTFQTVPVVLDGKAYFVSSAAYDVHDVRVTHCTVDNYSEYRSLVSSNEILSDVRLDPSEEYFVWVERSGDSVMLCSVPVVDAADDAGQQASGSGNAKSLDLASLGVMVSSASPEGIPLVSFDKALPGKVLVCDRETEGTGPAVRVVDLATLQEEVRWEWTGDWSSTSYEVAQNVPGQIAIRAFDPDHFVLLDTATMTAIRDLPIPSDLRLQSTIKLPSRMLVEYDFGFVSLFNEGLTEAIDCDLTGVNLASDDDSVALRVSGDFGKVAAVDQDGYLRLFDAQSGQELWKLKFASNGYFFFDFLDDCGLIFAQDTARNCMVIDAGTGEVLSTYRPSKKARAMSCRYSSQTDTLEVLFYRSDLEQLHVRLFNLEKDGLKSWCYLNSRAAVSFKHAAVALNLQDWYTMPLFDLDGLKNLAYEELG